MLLQSTQHVAILPAASCSIGMEVYLIGTSIYLITSDDLILHYWNACVEWHNQPVMQCVTNFPSQYECEYATCTANLMYSCTQISFIASRSTCKQQLLHI
mmetsp:Transcript_42507/g.51605  ORF Transcript_42507/g.51605 Transcript_42507/m.51605 type:complete len:100 (-) Transcript_42507:2353-2652(-)